VELNDKAGFYELEFTNLGLKTIPIDVDFVKRHPRLLMRDIWEILNHSNALAFE
jgi:ATP-dependent Lon protease